MAKYFEVVVKYHKLQENGEVKRLTEHYLVDAVSLSESEERVTRNLQPFVSSGFIATSTKVSPIAELMGDDDASRFYLAKVALITLDEKSGREKRAITQILVGAEDFEDALRVLKEGFKGTMADWELASLSESKILEVF